MKKYWLLDNFAKDNSKYINCIEKLEDNYIRYTRITQDVKYYLLKNDRI